jgi:HD-GYP domain-containing protein (c-di-GMP phosphodiesterase class II)
MRLISINSVRIGTTLAKTLYDNNGRVLIKNGVELSETLISSVKRLGIYSLYVNDKYSDNEIDDIIKPELRQKVIVTLKNALEEFQNYSKYINNVGSNKQYIKVVEKRNEYISQVKELAEEMIEQILSKKQVMIELVDIKSMDNYTYQHSVNVAVLSVVLGIHLQLNRGELYELTIGAILHDTGKMFIPTEIIKKPGKLTDEEYEIVKEHSLRGYEHLKKSPEISGLSRIIAKQHHEKVNGNGYPNSLVGDEINKLSKIVAITDVYDALTSDRPYRLAMSPNDALEYIMGGSGSEFDYKMVKVFAKTIVPYSEGTIVKLSDGSIGVVVENYAELPLRPRVRVIKDESTTNYKNYLKYINLSQKMDVVILGIEKDI